MKSVKNDIHLSGLAKNVEALQKHTCLNCYNSCENATLTSINRELKN